MAPVVLVGFDCVLVNEDTAVDGYERTTVPPVVFPPAVVLGAVAKYEEL